MCGHSSTQMRSSSPAPAGCTARLDPVGNTNPRVFMCNSDLSFQHHLQTVCRTDWCLCDFLSSGQGGFSGWNLLRPL